MAEEEVLGMEFELQQKRSFTGLMATFITIVALAFSFLEIAALQFWVIDLWASEALVLILVMILGFSTIPSNPKNRGKITNLDLVFMIAGVAPCIYILVELERLQWTYGATVLPLDIVFSTLLIVAVLELTRRCFGLAMPLICLVFLAYALFGNYLPSSLFGHTGLKPGKVIGFMIGNMAIFGLVMGVFVQIIFIFMLFSAFIQLSGAGQLFVNLANAVAGRWRGGAAKVAVFSSSSFGTISGNSVANVAVDGGITIPLMIRTGFKPTFAAAVEATASTGGQIMPPVMGAGAFIMAELLGIPYKDVVIAAVLPASLYYFGLYCMIDLEAVRSGLRGQPRSELPGTWLILKRGGHLLIPILILIHQLFIAGASLQRAGLYSTVSVVVVSWFRKNTQIGFYRLIHGLKQAALISVSIAAVCACAGIIVGVVSMTGIGVKFGSGVVALSQGNVLLTLLLTAVICLFLGMGLPTTAAYIIVAAVGTPALLNLGVNPLCAHLFVFYFACISAITPPVCGAVYTACGFSQTSVMQTGWVASRLGIAAYVVPFLFVLYPVLIFQGSFAEMIQAAVTSIIGVGVVSMAIVGTSYIESIQWSISQRILLFGAFLGLIIPGTKTDFLGTLAMSIAILSHPEVRKSATNLVGKRKKQKQNKAE